MISFREIFYIALFEIKRLIFTWRFILLSIFLIIIPLTYTYFINNFLEAYHLIGNIFPGDIWYIMLLGSSIAIYLVSIATGSGIYSDVLEEDTVDLLYTLPASRTGLFIGRIMMVVIVIFLSIFAESTINIVLSYIYSPLTLNFGGIILYTISLLYPALVFTLFIGLLNVFVKNVNKTIIIGLLILFILPIIDFKLDLFYIRSGYIIKFLIDLMPHRIIYLAGSITKYFIKFRTDIPPHINIGTELVASIIYFITSLYILFKYIAEKDPI